MTIPTPDEHSPAHRAHNICTDELSAQHGPYDTPYGSSSEKKKINFLTKLAALVLWLNGGGWPDTADQLWLSVNGQTLWSAASPLPGVIHQARTPCLTP
ncbi:hypothetical protein BaRGS_00015241 [Batillaria attramentaria]|uniref:Uncharacterized protein n=1 Tax=Batillaria attramentaria TaxID=370345 RepID=A0ABD0L2I5_9CAEN